MKKFLNIIFCSILSLGLFFQSCKSPEKKEIQKNKNEKKLVAKDCACIEADKAQSPPPIKNSILKSDEVKVIEKEKSYPIKIELIADQLVNYEGKKQQIFRIERVEKNRTGKINTIFYFALSPRYNKFWNEITFFAHGDSLQVGFKQKEKVIVLYRIYSYKYTDQDFGGGEIVIESLSNRYYEII